MVAIAIEGGFISIYNSTNGSFIARVDVKYTLNALSFHPNLNLLVIAPNDRSSKPDSIRLISYTL